MKRNFPKLIALSLIFSLSVTPIANAESNSNIKAKDKKHVQVNVEDKSVPTDVRNLAQKTFFLMLLRLIKSIIKRKPRIRLVNLLKFTNSTKRVMVIIIFLF